MAQISNLSCSLEDYLEIILQLVHEKGEARVKEIAARKAVRMASVTGALKRPAKEQLIVYKARESVTLTDAGYDLAGRVLKRHQFIARFLGEVLGVPADTASRDACAIEHVISLDSLDRLAGFMEFLRSPVLVEQDVAGRFQRSYAAGAARLNGGETGRAADGGGLDDEAIRIFSRNAVQVQLTELKPGERCRVVSVRASTPIRQRLVDMGLLPGVELIMQRVAPLGDPIDIKLRGFHLSLRKIEAATIGVERL
jgi:DtxR family Mn-dependent transcriptional regulator